ncbi:TIGR00725 family protein [Streptomyces mangrovisoli]|uniref:TIGR00725 family protein n=1 Tax=Streptomyces mangrovisoli TaxID=1428628 RepID=A0A1J4NUS5_9ACTN|nr:TIGR00725 family protein [Streptomyces mangrovisoli]OIJ65268.1 TIGR00725 family protein [Streptomyces mangrovisoli]
MSSRATPYIAVCGPGHAGASERDLARRVGALLARRGAVVVCGGLGGVMAACAEGATSAGGTVLGLLPGDDRGAGDPHLTVVVATGLGELRNGLLVTTCDALVAIGGGWGTLSEVALALRAGKPVAVLRGWELPEAAGETHRPLRVGTPEQAVEAVLGGAEPLP